MDRYAIVAIEHASPRSVAAALPTGYRVVAHINDLAVLIRGTDAHSATLEHVLAMLCDRGITGREITPATAAILLRSL